jgi:hypothetical protein
MQETEKDAQTAMCAQKCTRLRGRVRADCTRHIWCVLAVRRMSAHVCAHASADACAQDAHVDIDTYVLGAHAESDTCKLSHTPLQAFLLLFCRLYSLV